MTDFEQRLSGASLLVFANKTDVQGCMTGDEIAQVRPNLHTGRGARELMLTGEQALQLKDIRTHRWNILRCSAMTGENLKEGLAWVVEDAKARLFLY
jgi:ADP-ribosylation factor-like protein 2